MVESRVDTFATLGMVSVLDERMVGIGVARRKQVAGGVARLYATGRGPVVRDVLSKATAPSVARAPNAPPRTRGQRSVAGGTKSPGAVPPGASGACAAALNANSMTVLATMMRIFIVAPLAI